MDDSELDGILGRANKPWAPNVSNAVDNLIITTRDRTLPQRTIRKKWSRSAVLGSIAVGTVLLTAGASITAAQLGIAPFQTIEAGTQRTTTAIPIDYVDEDGQKVHCLAFMEFRNLDSASGEKIDRFIATNDWSGFGQDLFNAAQVKATPTSTATEVVMNAVDGALYEEASQVFPSLRRGPADTAGVTYNGSSMSCRTQSE
jgi:hypothetical protein